MTINDFGVNNVQDTSSASTNHGNSKDEVSKSKKHYYSEIQGAYYCTYLVDESGGRILISRIPVSQISNNSSQDMMNFEKVLNSVVQNRQSRGTDLEENQQAVCEASQKINRLEMMQLLQNAVGVPGRLQASRRSE